MEQIKNLVESAQEISSRETRPVAQGERDLKTLNELELLLCGGGQDTPCW